jgi:hypothetical protein
MTRVALSVAVLFLLTFCAPERVDRDAWQRMTREERVLYVRSLIGEQKAKEAKGGSDRVFARPAEEYATRIDEAYARGDARDAARIFEDMGAAR